MIICKTHFDVYVVWFFIDNEKYYEQGKTTNEQKQQQTDSNFHH